MNHPVSGNWEVSVWEERLNIALTFIFYERHVISDYMKDMNDTRFFQTE